MPVEVNRDGPKGDNMMLPQTDASDRPKTPPIRTTTSQPSSADIMNSLLEDLTPSQILRDDFDSDKFSSAGNTTSSKPEHAENGEPHSDQCEAKRTDKKRKAEQPDPILFTIQSPNGNTVTVAGDANFSFTEKSGLGIVNPLNSNLKL
jgi:hypothetical protein